MSSRSADHPFKPARILLVDDNQHGLTARKCILEELGYVITICSDPLEALECFGKESYDLLITDYKMPHMDGVELIVRIRSLVPETPAILISGFVDTLGMTEENTGADAVIQKSANEVQQLLRTVARVLRKKAPKKTVASVRGVATKAKAKGAS